MIDLCNLTDNLKIYIYISQRMHFPGGLHLQYNFCGYYDFRGGFMVLS